MVQGFQHLRVVFFVVFFQIKLRVMHININNLGQYLSGIPSNRKVKTNKQGFLLFERAACLKPETDP